MSLQVSSLKTNRAIGQLIEEKAPAMLNEWELRLADAGYDPLHDYSGWRWVASDPLFHQVVSGFPRITAPVPLGVSEISYRLALLDCERFRVEWESILTGMIGEDRREPA